MKKGDITRLSGFVGVSGNQNPRWSGTKDIPKDFFSQYRRNAAKRNHAFKLTIDDLQTLWDSQEGKCAYTGQSLHFKRNRAKIRGRHDANSAIASLDRIDSSKPYEIGNVQFIAAPINIMKNTYSESEFLRLVSKIYNHKIRLTKL